MSLSTKTTSCRVCCSVGCVDTFGYSSTMQSQELVSDFRLAWLLCVCRTYNADATNQPPSQPQLLYSLAQLEEQLKASYKLVTEGKFVDALKVCVQPCVDSSPAPNSHATT